MRVSLYDFIDGYYEEVTNQIGQYQQFNFSKPTIKDCSEVISFSQKYPFIELIGSSIYKKVANIIMHIFYASPLETTIAKNSPIDQFLKIKEFSYLANVDNHQNALIAIAYGLYAINQEQEFIKPINISCHSFVELAQVLCVIDIKEEKALIASTQLLALLLEQTTYKTNPKLQYKLCPDFYEN